MKTTTKRPRAQAAVILPRDPGLAEHAAAIKRLGRQTLNNLVEIGGRLLECRKLLKTNRQWLLWLKVEFGWSHTTADRVISLFENRAKLHILCNSDSALPVSALYLLAKASPEIVKVVEQRVERGEPTPVRIISQLIGDAQKSSASPVVLLSAPEAPPTPAPVLDAAAVRREGAKDFVTNWLMFTAERAMDHDLADIAAIATELSKERRTAIRDVVCNFSEYLLKLAKVPATKPRLVIDHTSTDSDTKH